MSDTKLNPMTQHGAFSWNELMTTNIDVAKTFYQDMFNWQFEDLEMDQPYTMAKIDNQEVAGLMSMPPGTDGMPPMWGSYITVDDVDKSTKQALALGGTVFMEPRDITGVGRFAVIADPQGAVVSIITYFPQN